MAIGKRLRFEIFKRDSFACAYCGRTPPSVTLQVDHIHPVSKGGTDDEENLITACFECNNGKSNIELGQTSITTITKEKLQLHRERAEQIIEYNNFCLEQRQERERLAAIVSDRWLSLKGISLDYVLCEERMISIRMFIERLALVEVLDAVEIAWVRRPGSSNYDGSTWKYFCGVCWNKIKRQGGTSNG